MTFIMTDETVCAGVGDRNAVMVGRGKAFEILIERCAKFHCIGIREHGVGQHRDERGDW